MNAKKLLAEAVGTAMLVFFAVGVATLSFGFGAAGSSIAAGVVATALAFGFVLLVLAYAIGPVSGCHINPAVTMGFLVSRRVGLREATGYWAAQVTGGVLGAALLYGVMHTADAYRDSMGLGANGFGTASMVRINATGAVVTEVVLTFLFVFAVLSATRKMAPPVAAGLVIGLALTVVHLVGIPLTGTSVNPARSIGPALFVGDLALSQLWVFVLAPLVGGALAAVAHEFLFPRAEDVPQTIVLPEQTAAEQPRTGMRRPTGSPVS